MIPAVNRADLAEVSFYAVLRSVRVHPSSIESSRAHNSYSEGAAYLWSCSTDLPENQFCATQGRTLYRAVLQTDAGRKIKFLKLPRSQSYPILPYIKNSTVLLAQRLVWRSRGQGTYSVVKESKGPFWCSQGVKEQI